MTSSARFLVPFCLPMMSVMFLKYASSNCTICSKIWVSWGRCSRNVSNHFRMDTVESPDSAQACFTGIAQLQHQSTIHHVSRGSFRLESQLCESRVNRIRQSLHRYLPPCTFTLRDLHAGQKTFLPNKMPRRYLRICDPEGI